MDSIVIMDLKMYFNHNFNKTKRIYVKKMQEKMRPWMSTIIKKYDFINKECKVLSMHVEFLLLTLIRKEMCLNF
jgi:hypothetical protein